MRCVKDDRAAIVGGGILDNIGVLVTVLRPAEEGVDVWVVKTLCNALAHVRGAHDLVLVPPGTLGRVSDKHLWPLRDRPGVDETLILAGVPKRRRFDRG